jgi:hypothetical protein
MVTRNMDVARRMVRKRELDLGGAAATICQGGLDAGGVDEQLLVNFSLTTLTDNQIYGKRHAVELVHLCPKRS